MGEATVYAPVDGMLSTHSLSPRPSPVRFRLPEALFLVGYAALLLWVIPHHEPWMDEAQGWMIARTCTLAEALTRVLHYEVAPALWQLVLRPLAALNLPFRSANWVSALLGVASTFLLLRWSPFPRAVRWALPFTFFLQYQYAVVARPYAFFPVLAFALCILFTRHRSPIWFAAIAGLLANANLHCTVYAAVAFCVYLFRLRKPAGEADSKPAKQQVTAAIAVFSLAVVFAVAVAFPAPDQYMMGAFRHSAALSKHWLQPEQSPAGLTPDPSSVAEAQHTPATATFHFYTRGVLGLLVTRVIATALFSVSQYNLLAAGFLLLCAAWLWRRGQLLLLLPPAAVALSYSLLPDYPYQSGLFFVGVIASLWVALDEKPAEAGSRLGVAFAAVAAIMVTLQIGWALKADRDDVRGTYDAGGETTQYLQTNFPNARIAAFGYEAETLNLYLPVPPLGWTHPFWTWSRATSPNSFQQGVLAMHPDVLVLGSAVSGNRTVLGQIGLDKPGTLMGDTDLVGWWQQQGWRVVHYTCGSHFGYGGYTDLSCLSVLVPPAH